MRIITLLPAATEIVAALGAEADLVGISHECDWPRSVQRLPRVTTTPIDRDAPSGAIDQAVRKAIAAGRPVIAVDGDQLRELAPELIITQGLCEVCAVDDGQAYRIAEAMHPSPDVISLRAKTIEGIEDDIRLVGNLIAREAEAERLIAGMEARLDSIRQNRPAERPRVVCIEWADPLYLAGHWVPELVAAAGGLDVGAEPGSHSVTREWDEVAALEPDVVFVLLCGMDLPRAQRELDLLADPVARDFLTRHRVHFIDGNAYTSRPGPRVVEAAAEMQGFMKGEA
ncbi:MAG TPA: ABC transporter substrate-binding protein [Gemmatimonadales bacterium]|nr:ABC transporter substrate-binding protein [Gemmatimonadales bacterium]